MGIDNISFPDEYTPEKRPKEFFLKVYTWEDLGCSSHPDSQLTRDMEEAIALDNFTFMKVTGSDEKGEFKGMIRVTMEFIPDNG